MLSYKPYTALFRQVFVSNSAAVRGKVVMDLGCGTGVISLFCARLAEPAAVYALEASSMVQHTEELVRQNGYEGLVRVFQERAENLTLPGKVDVLVSEWMGNCLLVLTNCFQPRDDFGTYELEHKTQPFFVALTELHET